LYLGVHFAGDLVGGYVLGALVLAGFLWLEGAPAEWFARQPLWAQLAIAAIVPMVGFALLPAGADNGVSALGTLLGGGIGAILERRWVRFAVGGPIWQRALRLAVGLVLLLALRFGLKAAFAGLDPAGLFRLLRYALVGLMLTFGAPWLLCRIGLAPREAEA